jgi:hypothetical protein
MLTLLFVCLASVCNSVVKTLLYRYDESILRKLNKQWWNPDISYKNKYIDGDIEKGRKKLFYKINYPIALTDAFHFFKTTKVLFWILAVVFYQPIFNILIDLFIYSSYKHMVFDLFYFHLFKKR